MHIRHQRLIASIMTWLLAPLAIVGVIALISGAQRAHVHHRHGGEQWSKTPTRPSPNASLPATGLQN